MSRKRFTAVLIFNLVLLLLMSSSAYALFGFKKKKPLPPEFNQKIILEVSDDYNLYQATRSAYDIGDLQSFHSQHTLPVLVEDAFKDLFGEVELKEDDEENQAGIETEPPNVPAIFEVKFLDVANDIYMDGADSYRGEATLAVAMKSPRGNVFWQKAFRGEGYVRVDPQFSTGLGPQDALVDAVHDAIGQMQDAIRDSPEVLNQLRHYQAIDQARREREKEVQI